MTSKPKLDTEERELLKTYERGEWRSMRPLPETLGQYKAYATAMLEAEGLVSIALQQQDLKAIQRKAAEAGVPYQTLIADILHQFVSGQLVEKPRT